MHGLRLSIGEAHTFRVSAKETYNWSGVTLEAGARYRVDVPRGQAWHDASITCGADGWKTEQLPLWKAVLVKVAEGRRRVPAANWFELIGALDASDATLFRIGSGCVYIAPRDADLYALANDLLSKYGNNTGELEVTVERIG